MPHTSTLEERLADALDKLVQLCLDIEMGEDFDQAKAEALSVLDEYARVVHGEAQHDWQEVRNNILKERNNHD